MSLRGVFQSIRFPRFPAGPIACTVVAELYGGQGEGKMKLVCTDAESEEDIYSYARWHVCLPEGKVAWLIYELPNWIVPRPGRYILSLFFDDSLVTSRSIEIWKA